MCGRGAGPRLRHHRLDCCRAGADADGSGHTARRVATGAADDAAGSAGAAETPTVNTILDVLNSVHLFSEVALSPDGKTLGVLRTRTDSDIVVLREPASSSK